MTGELRLSANSVGTVVEGYIVIVGAVLTLIIVDGDVVSFLGRDIVCSLLTT